MTKRIFPLLVSLAITPAVQAASSPAPQITPKPTPKVSPKAAVLSSTKKVFDPAAKALLNQSAKAYAGLKGLSLSYQTKRLADGKTSFLSGEISFSRPNKAKVTVRGDKLQLLLVSDGKKIYKRDKPKTYYKYDVEDGDYLGDVLGRIPSLFNVPLSDLSHGKSPLEGEIKWTAAALLPGNEVLLTLDHGNGRPVYHFSLYFDAATNLLRRVKVELTAEDSTSSSDTAMSAVTLNPVFAPDAFTFTRDRGAKRLYDPPLFNPKIKVGTRPFALKGKDINGKTHPWNSYRGKVVLLDFWATWCGPCVEELPNTLANYKKYHSKGFEIVGVSLDDDKSALLNFAHKQGMAYPEYFENGWKGKNVKRYGVKAIPFAVLIGKNGRIAAVEPFGKDLEPAIKKALTK